MVWTCSPQTRRSPTRKRLEYYSRNNHRYLGKTTATYFHYRRVLTIYKKVLKSPTPGKKKNKKNNIFSWNSTNNHCYLGKTTATYFHYRRVLTIYKKVLKSPTPEKQYVQLEYSTNNHRYLGKTTVTYYHLEYRKSAAGKRPVCSEHVLDRVKLHQQSLGLNPEPDHHKPFHVSPSR